MKKLLAIVLVASFAFVGAINASAVTIEELQAQIATLLQQIAALSGTSTPAPATTTCFSTDLQQGMTSNDVKLLQEKLGVINTGYFGPLTLSAVKTFQGQNSIPTTGYVGPMTRAALNAKYCVTTPVTTPTTTVTTAPVADATEGTLTITAAPVFVESIVKGGEAQKAVLAAKLEAKNSDINVQRVDVAIAKVTNDVLPWKSFSSFELYADDTLIKGIPALKDNFIENAFGSNYTLRFDNINFSVPKGGFKNLIVKASVLSNPEIKGVNYEYTFAFTNATTNAIRGKDGVGLDQYANSATTNQVTVDSSSTGTVTASLNSATPKLGFILGNATATTSNKEILKTDFKVENKDVTIKTLAYTMTDASSVVSAVKLYDGSTLVGSVAIDKGKATFTNLNINIAKDTTKTLTLSVDIKPNPGVGAVVKGALVHTDISGVDASDNSITKTVVTVTGKEQRVYTKSPFMALVSTNIVKTTQAGSADVADATVIMNVTANGGDIYINKTKEVLPVGTAITAAEKSDGGTTTTFTANGHGIVNGESVTIYGTTSYDGTYTATWLSADTFKVTKAFVANETGKVSRWSTTYTSTADAYDETYYVIRSGETKSITLTGRLVGGNAFQKMALGSFEWSVKADGSSPVITTPATYDLSTFETTSVYLANKV